MATRRLLKQDALGAIYLDETGAQARIERVFALARPGWLWLARRLAAREAQALGRLRRLDGLPQLITLERRCLVRSFVAGLPMHRSRPQSAAYFRDALRVLRRMHRAGVAHNDLAKEANWLCTPHGGAGIVDFQLAYCPRRRGRVFRVLAREDLRHLYKHKRYYRPDALTTRQRALLAHPSVLSMAWRRLFKPVYGFVTRRLLGWAERDGAEEREWRPRS